MTHSTALLKLELGDLSRPVPAGPGAQVLIQGKVIIAIIGNLQKPETIAFQMRNATVSGEDWEMGVSLCSLHTEPWVGRYR